MTQKAWWDLFCCYLLCLCSCPSSPFLCSSCPACTVVTDTGSCVGREWVLVLVKMGSYIILHNRSLLCGWAGPKLQKYGKLEIAVIKKYYSMLYILTAYSRLLPAWNLPDTPGNKGERDSNTNVSWRRGPLIVFWLIARLPALEKFACAEIDIFFMCRKFYWVLVGLYIFLMLPTVNCVKIHSSYEVSVSSSKAFRPFLEDLENCSSWTGPEKTLQFWRAPDVNSQNEEVFLCFVGWGGGWGWLFLFVCLILLFFLVNPDD